MSQIGNRIISTCYSQSVNRPGLMTPPLEARGTNYIYIYIYIYMTMVLFRYIIEDKLNHFINYIIMR